MFHDKTSHESNMNDDTQKPVPPLTARDAHGKRYSRFADVEAEIREVWVRRPTDWIDLKEKLKNETLVCLIHRAGLKDDYIRGKLQVELDERTIRISKGTVKGFDDVIKEEIALEVQAKVFELIWTDEDSSQAQYLEACFAKKVRDLTRNVIERYKHSVMAERDQLDVWTDPASEKGAFTAVELRRDVVDLRLGQEEMILLLEDEPGRDKLLQTIRGFVKDQRHFLALYLFYAEDKSLAEIARQFNVTTRQVGVWKATAMHQIRVGLGLETEEKREALRQWRRARRAERKRQSAQPKIRIRRNPQPPSLFI
jgi:hypothetical protein